jgi:hypothetical protein
MQAELELLVECDFFFQKKKWRVKINFEGYIL